MNQLSKIPPSAIDLEEAVLGAIMLEKQGAFIGCKMMRGEYFYKEAHRTIFDACEHLQNIGSPIDILTVTSGLRNNGKLEGIGGAYAISKITNRVASSANIEFHCKIIIQKYIARETIRISGLSIADSYNNNDPFDTIEASISSLFGLMESTTNRNDKSIDDYLRVIEEQQQKIREGVTPGVESFLPEYNRVSGGYHSGELIIIAGRPGMGKTANMMNEVHHNLLSGLSVIIHSLEMPGDRLLSILMAIHLKVDLNLITRQEMPIELLERGLKWIRSVKIKIYESNKLSSIRLNSVLWKATKGCDIVYIDYLQLARSEHKKTIDNVGAVSMGLKQLAKELESPIVALAQLNRSVETRGGDKKPILSDLRESGQIEQDADVVEFMYRPEYYGMEQDDDGNSVIGKAYRLNAKMRSGTPGHEICMDWTPSKQILRQTGSEFESSNYDGFKNITMQTRDNGGFDIDLGTPF